MKSNEILESELEDLKKQIWHMQRSNSPSGSNELEQFKTTVNANFAEIGNQIESLTQSISNLTTQISTITQNTLPLVNELSTKMDNLTDNVIPSIQQSIAQGSGGGGNGGHLNWTILYDKNSTDENINLGKPNGIIQTECSVLTELPDLAPYNFLRIKYHNGAHDQEFYFDITEKSVTRRLLKIGRAHV